MARRLLQESAISKSKMRGLFDRNQQDSKQQNKRYCVVCFFIKPCLSAIIKVVDVLWCQQIKLIPTVSTSEFMNIDGTTLILFFCPLHLVQGLHKG